MTRGSLPWVASIAAILATFGSAPAQEPTAPARDAVPASDHEAASDSLAVHGASLVERARTFRTLLRGGEYAAARAMTAPDPRRWWETRQGEGSPWKIGPGAGPWAAWDAHFGSRSELVEWRGVDSATAVVRETNDYFRLLERGWVTNEITYFFDETGRIEGLLIRAVGERPPGRTEEFLTWARANAPAEIETLMPGGEIDPSGDHPERFRHLLERWRRESGIDAADASPSDGPVLAFADSLLEPIVGVETAGFALLVVHRGEVVHRRAYGVADLETSAPFRTSTPSYLASVAKMFTAVAIASLVEEGRLDWDDQLGQLLPEAPAYAAEVTIRQMLDHTAGLPDHYDLAGEEWTYSNAEVVEILAEADGLLFEPGTESAYSNSAYTLLARIAERTTGRAFGAFLAERFFEPLGMADAVVADGSSPAPADRARGYDASGQGFQRLDYASTTTGAGGVYASLDDLARWGEALTAGRLLDDATLRLLSTPVVLPDGRPTPWGMGWLAESAGRGPLKGKPYVAAIGDLRGFHAGFQWYPDDDLLLAWVSNSNSPEVFDRVIRIPPRVLAPDAVGSARPDFTPVRPAAPSRSAPVREVVGDAGARAPIGLESG